MLSEESRESLGMLAERYHGALMRPEGSLALSCLSGRGISGTVIGSFRLGVVDGSEPDHAEYEGRISIPYVTKLGGVVGFKFRAIEDDGSPKYLSNHMPVRIYNPLAFERAEQLGYIGITEGEFDAMIATAECGIPSVGVPGVDTWKSHPEWRLLFDGFPRVLVFKDQDEPGEKLANRIIADIDTAVAVSLPLKDVNATFLEYGAELIRKAAGLDLR